MEIKDYYSALGLSPSASLAEVKRSYRRLVKLVHPDSAGPGTDGRGHRSGQFLKLQEAYETLSDPVRRAEYDGLRAAAGPETAVAAEQGADLWSRPRGPAAPLDDLSDQLERFGPLHSEWGGGGLGMPAGSWGDRRGGPRDGRRDGLKDEQGDGRQDERQRGPEGGGRSPDLRGARSAPLTLELTLEEAFGGTEASIGGRRVRIPPGSRDGMRLRIPGGPGLVEVRLRPHPRYTVEGDDLRTELAVPASVFRRGGRVTFAAPGGRLTVALPPGLAPGKLVRLRGRGLPATQLRRAGDILIRLALAGRSREEGVC